MDWSGPAIRPGLDNRHLIIEGHRGLKVLHLLFGMYKYFVLEVL